MIYIMHNTCQFLILFLVALSAVVRANAKLLDIDFEDYMDEDSSVKNQSLTVSPTTKSPSSLSSSFISKVLFTQQTSLSRKNNSKSSVLSKKQSTSSSSSSMPVTSRNPTTTVTPHKTPLTAPSITPYMIVSYLVNQFNHYRNIDILSRIKQCDSNMKLYDMCETYSFDNHSYSLIRESNVEFQSLRHLYDTMVDRMVVQKLSQSCPTGQWCLGNLTQEDTRFTLEVLQQRGRSLCTLEKCFNRLTVHATACPSIAPKNISTPTLKLLPMLCALYNEQPSWNTPKCINEIMYLLHILYAFWPQLETCHRTIADSSGRCTAECLMFDTIFRQVEHQCSENATFLTRVPSLAWYRLVNLKQVCRHELNATNSPLISSVKNFISSNLFWYRLHQRPVYAALFIITVICVVMSFSLCLYIMSKTDANTRRFDDDYEYTRLHESTLELGAGTEIPNSSSISDRTINESQFDMNGNHRLSEHQRLLYMES